MSGLKVTNQKDFVENTRVLYQGLGNFKVVAINPTGVEIKKLLNIKESVDIKDPNYLNLDLQKDGVLQNKIVFYIQGTNKVSQPDGTIKVETINDKVEFLVANRVRVSSTGKQQLFDSKGNNNWVTIESISAAIAEPNINETRKKILTQFFS